MKKPSPARLEAARLVLARAGGDAGSAQERAAAAGQVCDKVCLHLAQIVGTDGVLAIFGRSVKLVQAEHPCIEASSAVDGRGVAPGDALRACGQEQGPAVVTEIAVTLLATIFDLLATFIGDRLTAQVLRGAWQGPDERET